EPFDVGAGEASVELESGVVGRGEHGFDAAGEGRVAAPSGAAAGPVDVATLVRVPGGEELGVGVALGSGGMALVGASDEPGEQAGGHLGPLERAAVFVAAV